MAKLEKLTIGVRITDMERFRELLNALTFWSLDTIEKPVRSRAEIRLINTVSALQDDALDLGDRVNEPCPFCGAGDQFLNVLGRRTCRAVYCECCEMQGPAERTTAMAWASYNARTRKLKSDG